jgi:two-component system, LytTR family, response regulator
MITALLVDDEPNNLESLAFLLQNDCEGVAVAAKVGSAMEAREWLSKNPVDVIFLDINMPGETGFDLLNSLPKREFQVVFVSAYNEFALQAIKASALDYILKPVNIDELCVAVKKLKSTLDSAPLNREQNNVLLEHLLHTVSKRTPPAKIALPHLGGINFIEVAEIVSLQADSNYTVIHMRDMQKLVITKTLKEFEELLDADRFARIHKSYIVNLNHIREYSSADGGLVKMIDGNQWSISRRQLDMFLSKMKHSSLMFGK